MTDRGSAEAAAASRPEGWPLRVPAAATGGASPRGSLTFSVVVAAHQAEATIVEAIDSALAQTRPPLEVVVCDDGSTDRTAELLSGYGSRIRVVHQENGGEAAAKNAAVAHASGEYVVVLDADDVFLPRRLEALAWLAERRPDLDVLTTDAVVEADGRPVRRAYHSGWTFPVEDQRSAILSRNFVLGLAAVRRDRWLAVGGFDESISRTADWDFWIRLILSGSRVGLVDEPLARYRLSSGSLSADRTRLVAARIDVLSSAAERDDLTTGERAVVQESLTRERRDLSLRLADLSLTDGGGVARKRNAVVVVDGGVPPRRRLRSALAVVSPALARRWREHRSRGTVEIGSGVRVTTSAPRADDD